MLGNLATPRKSFLRDDEKELWYFAVSDVIAVLTKSADPELAINRALKTYLQKGYSREWINQRLKSIEIRKTLTDEWEKRGAKKGLEFAILTNEITKAWTGMTTKEYKNLKDLKKENLRDNMTNLQSVQIRPITEKPSK